MTLKVTVSIGNDQSYRARVVKLDVGYNGAPFLMVGPYETQPILSPGDSVDLYISSGSAIHVHELPLEKT